MYKRASAGFTLIEVMIAVVILAVGLSALFTSEAGAIRIAQRARTTTVATLLARCKMGEIEERIAKEGWPGNALDERDECCEDAEHEGFSCEWKVDRIVLPDAVEGDDPTKQDALEGIAGGGAGGGDPSNGAGGLPGAAGPGGTPTDPTQNFGIPLTGLGGVMGGGGEGSGDPIASMVMQYAFPVLKPTIEEQVRRVTVKVLWKEGSAEQSFEVVQFLVNELPMLAPDDLDENGGPGGPGGAAGGPGGPGGAAGGVGGPGGAAGGVGGPGGAAGGGTGGTQ